MEGDGLGEGAAGEKSINSKVIKFDCRFEPSAKGSERHKATTNNKLKSMRHISLLRHAFHHVRFFRVRLTGREEKKKTKLLLVISFCLLRSTFRFDVNAIVNDGRDLDGEDLRQMSTMMMEIGGYNWNKNSKLTSNFT